MTRSKYVKRVQSRTPQETKDKVQQIGQEIMTTQESNRLIAEFMHYPTELTYKHWSGTPLAYHKNWQYLMSVVEKCTQIGYRDTDFESEAYLKWEDLFGDRESMFLGNHIEEVYATVVEFIKWFNTQQIDDELLKDLTDQAVKDWEEYDKDQNKES